MIYLKVSIPLLIIKKGEKTMKNKKQEAFDIDYFNHESFDIEEEGIEEEVLSLDELLDEDIKDGIDDLIDNLIESIFG